MKIAVILSITEALTIYMAYNMIAVAKFGIPHSLSTTYYLWQEEAGKGWRFSLMMYVVVLLMMPAWITLSEGSTFQFLSFLAPASLLFVATAPGFKRSRLENRVHSTSAILAAVFSLAWIVLVTPYWWTILIWFCIVAVLAVLTSSYKTALVYWLETIAFGATFTSALLYAMS